MDLLTSSTSYSQGDHSWLRSSHGTEATRTITLDLTTFAKATHFPDGFIPSGMSLGVITANPDTYGPYDSGTPGDGRDVNRGHLFGDVQVANDDGTDGVGYALGAIFTHGVVVAANLPSGDDLDAAGQADLPSVTYV
jgi:hypothetical protein